MTWAVFRDLNCYSFPCSFNHSCHVFTQKKKKKILLLPFLYQELPPPPSLFIIKFVVSLPLISLSFLIWRKKKHSFYKIVSKTFNTCLLNLRSATFTTFSTYNNLSFKIYWENVMDITFLLKFRHYHVFLYIYIYIYIYIYANCQTKHK